MTAPGIFAAPTVTAATVTAATAPAKNPAAKPLDPRRIVLHSR